MLHQLSGKQISQFHVAVVAGLFMYIGKQRQNTNPLAFQAALVLGLAVLYHHGRILVKACKQQGCIVDQIICFKNYPTNVAHVVVIAPLLYHIGTQGVNMDKRILDSLFNVGVGIALYHGRNLLSQ